MLAEPDRSPYDLRFRLFGFPVRVHPLFWVLAALLGASWLDRGVVFLLIWVAVAFVSILVHEFGHALAFRCFRVDSHIVLYSFGGLAVPWSGVRRRWQQILVSLAGPAAGFLLCAAVYFSNYFHPWARTNMYVAALYLGLFMVNLYWGIMNLLPIWPLDGGQVSEEVCSYVSPRNGRTIALQISVAVAVLICVYSLACVMGVKQQADWLRQLPWWVPTGSLWTAILFGMLAYRGYQRLQQLRWTESHWER